MTCRTANANRANNRNANNRIGIARARRDGDQA